MSEPAGRVRALRPSRWTLRTRLLAAVVGLVALVCLVIGVTTTLTLRHVLLDRVNSQLVAAGARSQSAGGAPPGGSGAPAGGRAGTGTDTDTDTGARFLLAPGQPAGTLGARVVGGRVAAAQVLEPSGALAPVSPGATAVLAALAADNQLHTRALAGLGDYRLVAARTADGDVLITGLPLGAVEDTVDRLAVVETGVGVAALLGAGLSGAFIVRRTLRPLSRVARTASRVSMLPLERGEVDIAERVPAADTDPRTEVGQVGAALNRLLDHVGSALTARQASETRVRQFVADASHELRTPLASIRGYAELTRRSREQAPPDLAHAMGRVESEAARMTTLVEDLLLLARLDSGRPLATGQVDLTQLVVDAVSDAAAAERLGPVAHRWRVDLPDDPVTVTGDAAGLHQVLANLLANARTHTPAGTTVTVGLAVSPPSDVVLSVLDDGPGIAPALLPDVFHRFARGDTSRHRGMSSSSTGLGLAIVDAIVTAHGGTVHVTSRPGRTAFEVRLPVTGSATEAGS